MAKQIEPPNQTAAALVEIAGKVPYVPREGALKQGPRPHGNGPLNLRESVERIEADNERL